MRRDYIGEAIEWYETVRRREPYGEWPSWDAYLDHACEECPENRPQHRLKNILDRARDVFAEEHPNLLVVSGVPAHSVISRCAEYYPDSPRD